MRAATNLEMKRLVGIRGGRRAVDLQKTITVAAPVDEVFQLWTDFENFPRFMTHVQQVERTDSGRWRWTVSGPAGVPVQWEAVITRYIPNEVIALKTLPGSTIAHAGIVRFMPAPIRSGGWTTT